MPTPSWTAPDLTPEDLLTAAAICRKTLTPALDRDWSVLAYAWSGPAAARWITWST